MAKRPLSTNRFEADVYSCKKCSSFGSLCQKPPLVWAGNDYQGLVLIGESPHKSWLEGKNPFETPSGRRIKEYLEILGLTIDNAALLEVSKCLVEDRKNLKKMMTNCLHFLLPQVQTLNPKLIISFGRMVEDVAGVVLGKFEYIPLLHPSPINPKNHQRNLEFLSELAEDKKYAGLGR
jgi:uracil-DNA glycosylase family 4